MRADSYFVTRASDVVQAKSDNSTRGNTTRNRDIDPVQTQPGTRNERSWNERSLTTACWVDIPIRQKSGNSPETGNGDENNYAKCIVFLGLRFSAGTDIPD